MAALPSVNLGDKFPALAKPPIVEAIITFMARGRNEWTPDPVADRYTNALSNYPHVQHMNNARFSFEMQLGKQPREFTPTTAAQARAENVGWAGLRLISGDDRRVVTPARDSLTLSWLGDYAGWTALSSEMMRVWTIHKGIAGIESIDQIHIRYVNRLEVRKQDFDPCAYFTGFGAPPAGMSRGPFLHQDTLGHAEFPKHLLNLVRTFEPSVSEGPSIPLLVVLEAVNAEPIPAEDAIISERLAEMHWLKNYAFFQSVTPAYLDLCK